MSCAIQGICPFHLSYQVHWHKIVLNIPLWSFSFFLAVRHMTCEISVPQSGVEPRLAVKVPSANHWTAREFPPLWSF